MNRKRAGTFLILISLVYIAFERSRLVQSQILQSSAYPRKKRRLDAQLSRSRPRVSMLGGNRLYAAGRHARGWVHVRVPVGNGGAQWNAATSPGIQVTSYSPRLVARARPAYLLSLALVTIVILLFCTCVCNIFAAAFSRQRHGVETFV